MRVLIVGGGAREHALAWRLSQDSGVEIIGAPGNAGIAREVQCWRSRARTSRPSPTSPSASALGLGVLVFVQVKYARGARQSLAEFEETIRGFPEVQECYMLMGDIDFLLKVVTRDVAAYEQFLREKLSRIPSVQEVRST